MPPGERVRAMPANRRLRSGEVMICTKMAATRSNCLAPQSQPARFCDADRGEIECRDAQSMLREPDAVAALAVGDAERRRSRPEQVRLRGDKAARRDAEVVLVAAETGIPPGEFGWISHAISLYG